MNVQLHERPVPKHEISSDDFGSDFSQASMGTRLRTGLHRVFRPRPKPPARSHDEPIRAELFSVERLEQHAGSLAAVRPVAPKPTKDIAMLMLVTWNAMCTGHYLGWHCSL